MEVPREFNDLIDKANQLNQSKEIEELTSDLKGFSFENEQHKTQNKELQNHKKSQKGKDIHIC